MTEIKCTEGIREIEGKFEDMVESICDLEAWADEYKYDRSHCKTIVKQDYNERNLKEYLEHVYTNKCHNNLDSLFSTFDMLIASRYIFCNKRYIFTFIKISLYF